MIADRVKDTSTTTGIGNFTLSGTAPTGFQALAAIGATGSTFGYVIDGGAEWEVGIGTITATNVFSRVPSASSNGGSLVNFSAGTKSVYHSITAAQHSQYMAAAAAAFATAIPLTRPGTTYMPQQTVASVLAFTAAASPVQGALVYLRLVADGTNAPTFTGMKEWGGSLGYDNRAGIANQVQFFYDGIDAWYSISQAVGATPTPVAPGAPTSVTATGGNASASVSFTAPSSNGNATITSYTATSSPGGFTGTVSQAGSGTITVNGLTNGTAYTFTVTATNGAGTSVPSSASNSVTPAASTVAGAPTIGTATAGDASASVTFTPPGSNGGSGITGYTVTSSPGGFTGTGTSSPVTVSGLTNGTAYTFTAKANNANGASTASAASNSVTPTAAASFVRLSQLASLAESGTGPYIYTGTGGTYGGTAIGGVANVGLQSGVDGSLAMTIPNAGGGGGEPMIGVLPPGSSTLVPYTGLQYAVYPYVGTGDYRAFTLGAVKTVTNTINGLPGDIVRPRRTGTTFYVEVARAASPTVFTEIASWTGVSTAAMKFQCMTDNTGVFNNLTAVGLA